MRESEQEKPKDREEVKRVKCGADVFRLDYGSYETCGTCVNCGYRQCVHDG